MKITFLGTSHGVPAANRFCSSYMIEAGNAVYLVDAGAPVADLVLRQGREITDVRAIFTTHIHGVCQRVFKAPVNVRNRVQKILLSRVV